MSDTPLLRWKPVAIGLAVVVVLAGGLAFLIVETIPVRGALATYTELIATANRPDLTDVERVATARRLCSERYLRTHELAVAPEGGLIGIPRNIHKNFQAWRREGRIWVCPTNRVGPLYQFVHESGRWRFDGPVGLLRPRGEIVPYEEPPQGER
ncbi:MAG: hypothetical protein P4L84_23135 [Isosphaeraceae bacterium]|nr:hypothetical protein [Isosphaeraceae bacterium]